MPSEPKLIPVTVPRRPVAVALVLHGGASRAGSPMVSPTQLSVLRMIPIARRIARLGADRLAVFRLLNSTRGWDARHTPADDARWALDRATEQLGERLPTCLVGHSLAVGEQRRQQPDDDQPAPAHRASIDRPLYAFAHTDGGGLSLRGDICAGDDRFLVKPTRQY